MRNMAQNSLLQYTSHKKALDKVNSECICTKKKPTKLKTTNSQLHYFTKYPEK